MYPVTFLVFGHPRLPGAAELEAHYQRLLKTHVRLRMVELPESRLKDPPRALREEADRLRPHLTGGTAVLLDAGGPAMDSRAFASWLEPRLGKGEHLSFALGTSHGFDPALKAERPARLSLSPMTFPHDLARVLFLEQLYRAFSILKGSPYNK